MLHILSGDDHEMRTSSSLLISPSTDNIIGFLLSELLECIVLSIPLILEVLLLFASLLLTYWTPHMLVSSTENVANFNYF